MPSEVLTLVCPECNSDMVVHQNYRLEVFTCPACTKTITVPYTVKAKAKAAGAK